MKLRVWWIPQIPMKAFRVPVETIIEARLLLNVLADYDEFQFRNNVKPDYSNVGGLEYYDGEEWLEWEDEDGNGIEYHSLEELRQLCSKIEK